MTDPRSGRLGRAISWTQATSGWKPARYGNFASGLPLQQFHVTIFSMAIQSAVQRLRSVAFPAQQRDQPIRQRTAPIYGVVAPDELVIVHVVPFELQDV